MHATGIPAHVAEQELFGTTHAALAAHVLARWGVALPVIDAVAHHHDEAPLGSLASAIAAVHPAPHEHSARQLSVNHAHN